jgi:predicted transcriptional regulator
VKDARERAVARELGISRQTVRRYLDAGVVAGVRVECRARAQPVRAAVEAAIHRLLEEAPTTRKQRLTAPRVVELLAAQGLAASARGRCGG